MIATDFHEEAPRYAAKQSRGVVLVVHADPTSRDLIISVLQRNGYDVLTATQGSTALAQLAVLLPDLIIFDVTLPDPEMHDFLARLKADANTSALPIIYLSAFGGPDEGVRTFQSTADSFIAKPIRPPELVARVRATLGQRPVPFGEPAVDRRSVARDGLLSELAFDVSGKTELRRALLSEHAFDAECKFDVKRADRRKLPLTVAYLELFELEGIRETVGQRGQMQVAREIAELTERSKSVARVGIDATGRFMFLINGSTAAAREVLGAISLAIVAHRFRFGEEPVRLTPIVGFATRLDKSSIPDMRRRAILALASAATHLDLQPVHYTARLEKTAEGAGQFPFVARVRASLAPLVVPLQLLSTFVGCLVVPFLAYSFLAARGVDVSNGVYLVCVGVLCLTALGICCENVLALRNEDPPSAGVYPAASAIIAAYLPNEAATVIETVQSFLRLNYAADLQIILAYNTPRSLPMEEELRAIADRDPRFVPMRIHGSTSKAQNVNAALRVVTGTFVGVFDADHKPDADSFTRAWDWLASGYDVVQGHCLIRNGNESFIAKLVAVEFESIYAVSHPGRARLHGFGIFGGSNGYWKTDLLRQTRMHRFMLTEDIDSSLRVIEAGYRIASDRKLISRELAPLTFRALWNQRLRWAQGWFQVSLKHLVPALKSPHLNMRQKAGMIHLLLWRECYVWMSLQILPILAFWTFVRHDHLTWFIPVFLATTIFTSMMGPLQLLFTYVLADDEIRRNRRWFFTYLVVSLAFFSEFKNLITRIAHIKEAMQERSWKVTPRTSPSRQIVSSK